MARRVTLSREARLDLVAVNQWLAQPGAGRNAARRRQAIADAITDLSRAPARWPVADHPGMRERPVAGYRVIYDVVPDTGDDATCGDVRILRIFGPGQDRRNL